MIEVDEKGIVLLLVAATATDIQTMLVSYDLKQAISVDRPFMFIIRDMEQNVNLFMGQFVDPEEIIWPCRIVSLGVLLMFISI